jgi:two-component system nitrogen regulation sensor histidine kinase NtrY
MSQRGTDASEGPGASPLSADRRRVAAALLGALAFVLLLLGLAWFERHGRHATSPSFLQYVLLAANVVLFFALAFYLLRYLIRLVSERRAGTLGSRFQLKLVATFIGLCLVPAVVLYAAAIAIMFEGIDRTLAPDLDEIVLDARAVAEQFHAAAAADLAEDVTELAGALATTDLVAGDRAPELVTLLVGEMGRRRLAATRVYLPGREDPLEVVGDPSAGGTRPSPLDEREIPDEEMEQAVAHARAGETFTRRVRTDAGLYVVASRLVAPSGSRGGGAVVVAARRVPADLAERAARLKAASEEHARLKAGRTWIKWWQALLFFAFVLLIILGATWVGIHIARSITVPIQRLAEGTAEVRHGNLSHVVHWKGRDELAVLVEAFNEMASDLRVKAGEVEGKTRQLEAANVELARVNVELGQRRDHMEMLLLTLSAGVIALDADGRVTVANPAAHQILQLADRPAVGQAHAELLAGESLQDLRREVERSLGRDDVRHVRDMVLTLERGPVHLQVVLTSQVDAQGRPGGLLLVFEDVTELVRAQALAAWQAVARRIAHEIKNPLTPIQLSAERLLKKFRAGAEDLPRVLESGVQTIISEVTALKQMVDEFSRFARMPAMRAVRSDLNAVVRSVADLYGGHEGVSISTRLAPDLPAFAFDPELVRRAIVNLVDNAVEAMDGRGRIEIATSLSTGKRYVRVEVADDGPGVPSTDREKLFLPYFTTKKRGTGLGLAIVHRIVADHHGRVRVRDAEPSGARFVIELPLGTRGKRAREIEAGPADQPVAAGGRGAGPERT